MRIGSLFSGYGGLDLAALQLFPGSSMAWHCEWDSAPSKILAHHWPEVPNMHDVTAVDWSVVPPIDVLTGGYPCQPFSTAGRRKGTDDERHLWPYVREAIRALRPRFALLENVAGHRALGFDRVLGDLAELGCNAAWTSVRADEVGAPHGRERVFILVTPDASRDRCGRGPKCHVAPPTGLPSSRREDDDRRAMAAVLEWGRHTPAVRRWERINGPSPYPYDTGVNGQIRPRPEFSEWLMGLPAGWVTNPDIGLSRTEQLKAIGNGVLPLQAVAAFSYLLGLEAAA